MSEINLAFEVYCWRPGWAIVHRANIVDRYQYSNVRYRIYINNDLITERSWVWNNNIFLNENIWIDNNNTDYNLKVEPITNYPNQAKFNIENFKVINSQADSTKINDLQVNFTLR